MKHNNTIISISAAMGIALAAPACSAQNGYGFNERGMGYGQGMGYGRGMGRGGMRHNPEEVLAKFKYQELSKQETENLIHMRGEEKLARDVYITLYETWSLRPFSNISNSEQRHMDAIKALLKKYNIEDPYVDDTVGVFADPQFTTLYNDLVAKGRNSLVDALTVGATIEDLDIFDLQQAITQTDNDDIKYVYQNLTRGSRNHLRAFTRLLRRNGVDYQPRYIDVNTYQNIVNSPRERCNR